MTPAARRALQGCRVILSRGMTPEERARAAARLEQAARQYRRPENMPHGHPYPAGWPA